MKRFLAPMSRIAEWEPPIPRQHLYAILMLAGFSVASVTLLPSPNELLANNPISVNKQDLSADAALADIPAADTEYVTVPDHELLGNEANPVDGLDEDSTPEPQWLDYQVKGDDNLSVIFNTLNLPAKTLHKLLEARGAGGGFGRGAQHVADGGGNGPAAGDDHHLPVTPR